MFNGHQKLHGHIFKEGSWERVSAFKLSNMDEVEYEKWRKTNEKKVYCKRDIKSSNIYFHRGHKTFSFYPNSDEERNSKAAPITLSHSLREDVILEMTEATFSLTRSKINKYDHTKYDYPIKFEDILHNQRIVLPNGNTIVPDLMVKFKEPIDLALKWNNTLIIEIVETHKVHGDNIKAYEDLGFGVIEVHDERNDFNSLNNKTRDELNENSITELTQKIRNYYTKSIWADLIVDPTPTEFSKFLYPRQNKILQEKVRLLNKDNKSLSDTNNKLESDIKLKQQKLSSSKEQINDLSQRLKQKDMTLRDIKKKVQKWNNSWFLIKLFKNFKCNIW